MDSSILWCNETVCPVAQGDPVLNGDPRVIQQLVKVERLDGRKFRFINNRCYFKEVQDEVQPHMRRILTKWMMEVNLTLFIYLLPFKYQESRNLVITISVIKMT